MLATTLAAGTLGSGHARARGRTVTLTSTEHLVLFETLVNGQPKCLSMKNTPFYVAGKLRTGMWCDGEAWHGTGHALVNGVEVVDHISTYSYPDAADGCGGGTSSGHVTFGNGPDGYDYAGTYEVCPAADQPNQDIGEYRLVLTMGYGRYLGASGHGFGTVTVSALPQKPPKPTEFIDTAKGTWTLDLAR